METSILDGIKKVLGIAPEYDAFDTDIIMSINTVFSDLHHLGIGPEEGFTIQDKTSKWEDFQIEGQTFNSVQTYIYLRVRMLFDPPGTSYLITAYEKQIKELEWRLNDRREVAKWTSAADETVLLPVDGDVDGGDPFTSSDVTYDGGAP